MKKTFLAVLWSAVLLGSCGGRAEQKSAPVYGAGHFNPGQTDAFPYAVRRGEFRVDLRKMPAVYSGPFSIMTLASTDSNYMWAVSTDRVS